MKAYENKERLVKFLNSKKKNKVRIWNRWRKYLYSNSIIELDLSYSDLRNSDLREFDLSNSNLNNSNLSFTDLIGADLDFSCLYFSCKTLYADFDDRQLIQILYHFAKPAVNSINCKDEDIKELISTDLFKKVVNKFHRVDECGKI